jgi:predicted DNA-binding WGR domain protein
MKRNLIAHYEGGGSDKVYASCIRDNKDGTFTVIGKWGRRGNLNQQTVKGTVRTIVSAETLQKTIYNEKLAKGYVDIESANYTGGVSRNDSWLSSKMEEEIGAVSSGGQTPWPKVSKKPAPKPVASVVPAAKVVLPEDDGVLVCVNNVGMEEKFDMGIEYVCEPHKDAAMVWVYDKFGAKAEFFADRFMVPSAYKRKTQNDGMKFKKFEVGETINVNIIKSREGNKWKPEFFTKKMCDRCGNDLTHWSRTLSWFSDEIICMDCEAEEKEIKEAIRDRGDDPANYEGIGTQAFVELVKELTEQV